MTASKIKLVKFAALFAPTQKLVTSTCSWSYPGLGFGLYDARVAARKHHDAVFVPARPSEGEVQAGSLQTQLLGSI